MRSPDWAERIQDLLAAGGPEMAFQPIVELWTGAVVGYEALSRFPDGISPVEWFEASHETHPPLYLELEAAAVRNAVAQLPNIPTGAYLSVNACEALLREYSDSALTNLSEEQLARIVVEISEHHEIRGYHTLVGALAPVRASGVRVFVDDFGAGYASLKHVLNLSPDAVKIDRALVDGIDTQQAADRRALLSAMADWCARIGVRLVCEGIETESEAVTIRALGVQYGQGYLYGRPGPLPAAKVPVPAQPFLDREHKLEGT